MPGTTPTPFQTPVLFPFEPDGIAPIVETVKYKTDIITSHNDSEDRIALRRRPTLFMKWRMTAMDLGEAGRAAGLLWKMGNRWYVPLWQHARQITAFDNLNKIYTVDMTDHRYDFSGKVLLWRNSGVNEVYDFVEDLATGVVLSNSDIADQRSYTNLSIAPWGGTAGAVMNQPGLDGSANAAATITDSDAVSVFQSRTIIWTVPNNNSLHAVHIWVRKDAITNRHPQFRITLSGGTVAQQTGVIMSTSTGGFSSRNSIGGGSISVRDMGTEWLVSLSVTNNTSGHTSLTLTIYPATSATLAGADDATNTGSIVVPKVVATLNPHTQIFTPGLDTYAVPLGIGTLSQSYSVERVNLVAGADVEFELDTTSSSMVTPYTPTQTFRTYEVLNIHPDTEDATDHEKWTLTSERVGGELGPFQIRPFATSPVLERKAAWTLTGRSEFLQFRKWLATRRGRRVPLWVPTYQDDLTLVAAALNNAGSLDIAAVDFANKFMGSSARVKIAVLQNGVIMPLVVTSVTVPSAGVERLFLETTTTAAVSLSAKICFLLWARLTEDKVAIEYVNNNLALVESSFTELPRETPL